MCSSYSCLRSSTARSQATVTIQGAASPLPIFVGSLGDQLVDHDILGCQDCIIASTMPSVSKINSTKNSPLRVSYVPDVGCLEKLVLMIRYQTTRVGKSSHATGLRSLVSFHFVRPGGLDCLPVLASGGIRLLRRDSRSLPWWRE